jgi:hypothetical protein
MWVMIKKNADMATFTQTIRVMAYAARHDMLWNAGIIDVQHSTFTFTAYGTTQRSLQNALTKHRSSEFCKIIFSASMPKTTATKKIS